MFIGMGDNMKSTERKNLPATGQRRLIHVVDDETLLLDLAEQCLESEGFDVRTCHDPSQALLTYCRARRKPTLILTDYQMQTMNGLELPGAFRPLALDMKVALASGTVNSDVDGSLRKHPDRFLAKPYGQQELVRLVHDLLD